MNNCILCGDSLKIMSSMEEASIDVIYLDPPFFTQDIHKLTPRENETEYQFNDKWRSLDEYLLFMEQRLSQCKRVLKDTGSIFLHCDRNAAHYLKIVMDKIFGIHQFQSEIIWYYKRWSNSKKGLLNAHQVIFFYSKTNNFKFNKIYTEYSATTNVDQILQDRVRDKNGKSKYKIDEDGEVVFGNSKKGVPLSDVWEIPYLNPKAKERVGYPTQKPVVLIEQILKLVTEEGDLVMDPFMGSGTTPVAAKLLNRNYIGIDQSEEAVKLAEHRLNTLIKTESYLLKKGRKAYQNLSDMQMALLKSIGATPVQRNRGIDGFLSEYIDGKPVSVKIQREEESLNEALDKLIKASLTKKCSCMILIRTHIDQLQLLDFDQIPDHVIILDQYDLQIQKQLKPLRAAVAEKAVI